MLAKNNNVVLRTIHGSIFLIDISDNFSSDKCAIYEINEIGRFLWDKLSENGTLENLVKALKDVIIDNVPYEILFNDVNEYINDLRDRRFLLEISANG